jgi:hypothetical protein
MPEIQGYKLDCLTPMRILNPAFSAANHRRANRELADEMRPQWKNWAA